MHHPVININFSVSVQSGISTSEFSAKSLTRSFPILELKKKKSVTGNYGYTIGRTKSILSFNFI